MSPGRVQGLFFRRPRHIHIPLPGLAVLAVTILSARVSPAYARAPQRPNVLILFVDQLRWSELGCYGNPIIRTPALDRLASQGVRFTHAHANFPSCSPARSTLLSGRHARSNGVYANQNEAGGTARPSNRDTTLAEALAAAGYVTAMIGKWHLAPRPRTLGFQMSWLGGMGPGGDGYMRGPWKADGGIGESHAFEGYTLLHQSDLAAEFLRRHRDRPFLLYLTPSPPHMPIASLPEPYRSMYDPVKVPLRPNVWKTAVCRLMPGGSASICENTIRQPCRRVSPFVNSMRSTTVR